jgi:hypothetical protein
MKNDNQPTITPALNREEYMRFPSAPAAAARKSMLAIIDDALRNLTLPAIENAPTTSEFLKVLDTPDDGNFRPKPFPMAIFADYSPEAGAFAKAVKMAQPTPATLAAVLDEWRKNTNDDLLTSAELETLSDCEAKIENLSVEIKQFAPSEVYAEFLRQGHREVADAIEGKGVKAGTQNWRSSETIYHEFAAKRKAIAEVQTRLGRETFPLVLRIRAKVMDILRSKMAELEETERAAAEKFCHPWLPGYLFRAIATLQIRLHPGRLKPNADGAIFRPRDSLEGILKF